MRIARFLNALGELVSVFFCSAFWSRDGNKFAFHLWNVIRRLLRCCWKKIMQWQKKLWWIHSCFQLAHIDFVLLFFFAMAFSPIVLGISFSLHPWFQWFLDSSIVADLFYFSKQQFATGDSVTSLHSYQQALIFIPLNSIFSFELSMIFNQHGMHISPVTDILIGTRNHSVFDLSLIQKNLPFHFRMQNHSWANNGFLDACWNCCIGFIQNPLSLRRLTGLKMETEFCLCNNGFSLARFLFLILSVHMRFDRGFGSLVFAVERSGSMLFCGFL